MPNDLLSSVTAAIREKIDGIARDLVEGRVGESIYVRTLGRARGLMEALQVVVDVEKDQYRDDDE